MKNCNGLRLGNWVAKANADLFSVSYELLDILMKTENDFGNIPKSIWEKRNSVIKRALQAEIFSPHR